MATRSKREKMLIIVGVPVVFIVVAWNFLSPPAGQTTQKGLLSAEDAKKKLKSVQDENKSMLSEQNKMSPNIAKMSYDVPAEQLVPRVIRNLQTIAEQSGVHLREIKPIRGKKLKSNAGVRVPVEVRFSSSFQPNAIRFLFHVEEADSRMVVDKINITSADPRFKTVEVSATITVFTTSLAGFSGGEGENSNASTRSNRG
jgi:Tfp pilus assembly protein PilO